MKNPACGRDHPVTPTRTFSHTGFPAIPLAQRTAAFTMDDPIPKSHLRTYEALFQDPPPGDLDWKAVRALVTSISEAAPVAQGMLRLTRRGRTLVLHNDRHKGRISDEDVRMVRRFLEGPSSPEAAATAAGARLVVVLSDRDARVFRIASNEGEPEKLLPYDPQNAGRTLIYMRDDPKAEPDAGREGFAEALARTMRGAAAITLVARGKVAETGLKKLADYLSGPQSMLNLKAKFVAMPELNPTPDQILAKVKALGTK